MSKPGISFLLPVLDEAASLPGVLAGLKRYRAKLGRRPSESLVVDNGSTDASVALAKKAGARVLHCPLRGYGAALRFGIALAKHPFVVLADADGTYQFQDSDPLIAALDDGADLVLASRLRGQIATGAMPWSHRVLGTPGLTALINLRFGSHITDCNAGHRALRRDAHAAWDCRSEGMEYASELVVQALRHGADVREVPGKLGLAPPGRRSHLRTIRDGLRNLAVITDLK
jgi:glycosyltransferase involved in cell wall biosynthesis